MRDEGMPSSLNEQILLASNYQGVIAFGLRRFFFPACGDTLTPGLLE